jgi:poly-beta-hydroxyalkanoate depolymerase
MATLREVIQENIEKAKVEVAKYEADLAALEAEGGGWLERDLKELQTWVHKMAAHLFSQAAVDAVAQPSDPVLKVVGGTGAGDLNKDDFHTPVAPVAENDPVATPVVPDGQPVA